MMINGIIFNAELSDILSELQTQLHLNQIPLINKIREMPDDIMITCPYHKGGQERKPSAGIRKSDGQFHCLACGETHSLQEMISHCFGHTDDMIGAFGWNWLLKNFLTVSTEDRKPLDLDFSRSKNPADFGLTYVSEEELDSYRYYHPYMWKRKMTPEVVDFFDIGYDKATQSITFPVRDVQGRTLFVARRSVKTKYFNYPAGSVKPVYGLYELQHISDWLNKTAVEAPVKVSDAGYPNEVIICESMIDAITCWVYGKYAVALNGLGDDNQFQQLNRLPCRKFILATDNDAAGLKARKRLRYKLRGKLISEYIFPDGVKDINDMSMEQFDGLQEVF